MSRLKRVVGFCILLIIYFTYYGILIGTIGTTTVNHWESKSQPVPK